MTKIIVILPKGRKDHIAELYADGGAITVCRKKVPDGSTIIESAKNLDLCNDCLIWLGRYMLSDFLGLDFSDEYKTSSYCAALRRDPE